MSQDVATIKISSSSEINLPKRTNNTQTFLEICVLNSNHKALEEHLVNNPVQQSDLDRCLLRGLQMVQREERELYQVEPTLTILLQAGAKWHSYVLLDKQKTPYHIICESPGDHHELLDLMIKLSQQTIIDTQDSDRRTALTYAVRHANINCLKCLIANGADVTIGYNSYQNFAPGAPPQESCPITTVMSMLYYSCSNKALCENIFNLLLDKSPIESYMTLLRFAANYGIVYCIKKLIEKGTRLDTLDYDHCYVWSDVAQMGNVELLKCMLDHSLDKDSTDQKGFSVLWYVVNSGNIEAVRYLLDLGVALPPYRQDVRQTQCVRCKEVMLVIADANWDKHQRLDPCVTAIRRNKIEIVKLLDEYGSQSCKSFSVLRYAVRRRRLDLVSYLLNKYTYPLNIEYINMEYDQRSHELGCTILTDPYITGLTGSKLLQVIKLLLDHGADPAKSMCYATSVNGFMRAIRYGHLAVIAQYVCSGVDINFRSYDCPHLNVLPFEASVVHGYHSVAEILLISGCSCGVFSLDNYHKLKDNIIPEMEWLMIEWKVQENNVTPLKQRCRCVILNDLSPRADLKIGKLPLPQLLIKFLSIPELDDILNRSTEEI